MTRKELLHVRMYAYGAGCIDSGLPVRDKMADAWRAGYKAALIDVRVAIKAGWDDESRFGFVKQILKPIR